MAFLKRNKTERNTALHHLYVLKKKVTLIDERVEWQLPGVGGNKGMGIWLKVTNF